MSGTNLAGLNALQKYASVEVVLWKVVQTVDIKDQIKMGIGPVVWVKKNKVTASLTILDFGMHHVI